jgi:glycosyltransferase involved in cell wall biosynthesis
MPDVILPVLDEAEALPWVLRRFPAGFTPIVVDNGSTDGSGRIARALGARVVLEPLRGSSPPPPRSWPSWTRTDRSIPSICRR